MSNLIICPVGMKVPTDPRWHDKDHWRYTNNARNYETLVIKYSDYVPEEGTFDFIVEMKGHKWPLVREVSKIIDINRYDYIGCVDDDLITDFNSFNIGLHIAKELSFNYWQLAMPPDSDLHPTYHDCLLVDDRCTFSETNFIEMGSPFFQRDKFKFLMEFLEHWSTMKVGLGIDKTFYDLFQCPANVIHCATIHQPFRESYYDKSESNIEMYDYLINIYPYILKKFYNRESNFVDIQRTFKRYKINYEK